MLRVRISRQMRLVLSFTGLTDAEIEARRKAIVAMAEVLIAGGRVQDVRAFSAQMAAAKTERESRIVRLAAEKLVSSGGPLADPGETFGVFAERWTSGRLAASYPDHVKRKKSAYKDAGILSRYVLPLVGNVPLVLFRIEHAQEVMGRLPAKLAAPSRRHVAQVMYRLLRLAVFPAKLIPASPLPVGFLPKLNPRGKAKGYLFPDEEARLLGCREVPLARRLLYGFLCREGMRTSEALGLTWGDIDLRRGTVNLDANKTGDPRSWVLGADVVTALAAWKAMGAETPFPVSPNHLAKELREDLQLAKVDRPELYATTETRRQLRAHDLRATFVTLALANGRTETWVADRTGHRSSTQIATYRRTARLATELGLRWLRPMGQAIPELRGGIKGGIRGPRSRTK